MGAIPEGVRSLMVIVLKGYWKIGLLLGFAPQIWAENLPSIAVDFDEMEEGPLTGAMVEEWFGELSWKTLEGRAGIVEAGSGKVLEVAYPEGASASSDSGAQFVVELSPSRYATLSYRFRPADGFPFVKGGKLPGLASGGSQFTGGRPPGKEGGWSARYMWRRKGALELYFYHPSMKGDYGERHSFDALLEPGRWVEITQRIDAGVPGKNNGRIEIEVDGRVALHLDGLELHGSRYGLIDTFLFSTFFGGSTPDWAPPEDTSMQFDDFFFSPEKPEFSDD